MSSGVVKCTYTTLFNNGLTIPRYSVLAGCPVKFNTN